MRIIYFCVFRCLKSLNLGSLIDCWRKVEKSCLPPLSPLLYFPVSFSPCSRVCLCSPDWLHALCPVPLLPPGAGMSSTCCHAGGIIFLVINTWHSHENTGLGTSDGPCNTNMVCKFPEFRYLNKVVMMNVEEIPFVLGGSVKYLWPKEPKSMNDCQVGMYTSRCRL